MNCEHEEDLTVMGRVFEVERFAIHDGTGIRTVVFLQGCPLKCLWCANPESQRNIPQIMYWKTRCIGCGVCVEQCPAQALVPGAEGFVRNDLCTFCGTCVRACTSMAHTRVGENRSVKDVFEEILRDKAFYQNTGGGVTFSGGEALSQSTFVYQLAIKCKQEGIHTALETSGYAPEKTFKMMLPVIDSFLYDFKCMDPVKHKVYTGKDNTLILRNFETAVAYGANICARYPVIGGYNDDDKNLHSLADYLDNHKPGCQIDLLPYHSLGVSKYDRLQLSYPAQAATTPSKERIQNMKEYLEDRGFIVSVGG